MVILAVSGPIDIHGGMGSGKLRLAVRLSPISKMLSFIIGRWKEWILTSDEKMT
jgi:hypothetical protein